MYNLMVFIEKVTVTKIDCVEEASSLGLPPGVVPDKVTFVYQGKAVTLKKSKEVTNNPENLLGINTQIVGWEYGGVTEDLVQINFTIFND